MTHACCLRCSARFSRETAADLVVCPLCGDPLDGVPAHAALGCKLLGGARPAEERAAVAAALIRLGRSGDAHA